MPSMPASTADDVVIEERVEALPAAVVVNIVVLLAGTALASLLFGLPLYVPVELGIVVTYVLARGAGPTMALVAVYAVLGYVAAAYMFGAALWPLVVVGAGATVLLCLSMGKKDGDVAIEGRGDPNVVPIILAVAAERAYVALVDATAPAALTGFNGNFLEWLGVFVLGTLPGVNPIIGVFFGIVTTGALAVYLVLLLKRVANPLAN